MNQKLVVNVLYHLEKEFTYEKMIKTGEFHKISQTKQIPLEHFSLETRKDIMNMFYHGERQIQIGIRYRNDMAKELDIQIHPIYKEIEEEKEVIALVEEYIDLKKETKEQRKKTIKRTSQTTNETIRLAIRYALTDDFKKEKLINEGILLAVYEEEYFSLDEIEKDVLHDIYSNTYVGSVDAIKCINLHLDNPDNDTYDSYFTVENVNERLKAYIQKEKEKERETPKESEKEKKEWIIKNGSDHLHRAYRLGYDCQRLYIDERMKVEYPDFKCIFKEKIKFKDRTCPSMYALEIEEKMREKDPSLLVRIKWLDEDDFKGEVVVIESYLGKYTIYKKLEKTNER